MFQLVARLLIDTLRYYLALTAACLGREPVSILELQMWCYTRLPLVWNMPCIVFRNFQGFILSNAHSERGLNRAASKLVYLAVLVFILWPLIVPFLSFQKGIRAWLTNWVVGLNRPDLLLTVGRGPYRLGDIEQLASSFLHFIPCNIIYALANYSDFEVDDKSKFTELCRKMGIPCVPNLDPASLAPDRTYIMKPKNEGQGRGIRKLMGKDASTTLNPSQHIVQDILPNHPEILTVVGRSSGLSTLRVLTLQTSEKSFHYYGAILRMGRAHGLVDNLSQGGIAVPVSDQGQLLKGATYQDLKDNWQTAFHIEAHPDTGAVFHGMSLPDFERLRELALTAHRLLCPHMRFCAWDVALTESGPVLVEGASYLGGAYEFVSSGNFQGYMSALALAIADAESLQKHSDFRRKGH